MLVFFTAEWCQFCHQMADEAFTHPQVVRLSEQFVCILVDADREPEVCRQFQVTGYPTIQFLSPRGVPLERIVGKKPGHQVMMAMQAALQNVARRDSTKRVTSTVPAVRRARRVVVRAKACYSDPAAVHAAGRSPPDRQRGSATECPTTHAKRKVRRKKRWSRSIPTASGTRASGTACCSAPGCGWWPTIVCASGSTKWGLALTITCATVFNSLLRPLQELFYGRAIERTQIKDAPIFIIGHWRSGTTLLHELLVLDGRYTYPTTYQCLAPNHFLISNWLDDPKLKFLLPAKRPMDNMATGWDRPQEDEFALANMGLPSPYLTMAFPNEPPQCAGSLSLDGLCAPTSCARWKQGLEWFLTRVTRAEPQANHSQVAAPHGPRQDAARTVSRRALRAHRARSARGVRLDRQALENAVQVPGPARPQTSRARRAGLRQLRRRCTTRWSAIGRWSIRSRFFEVRYEDLVRDPLGQMQALYEHLGLGEFEIAACPSCAAYFADRQGLPDRHATRRRATAQRRSTAAGDRTCASTAIASRRRRWPS